MSETHARRAYDEKRDLELFPADLRTLLESRAHELLLFETARSPKAGISHKMHAEPSEMICDLRLTKKARGGSTK
eukprot:6178842-Pleurochrysis_carterae.AAC.1